MPIRSRLSINTAEAAIDAAIAGVGVTRVLSYQAAQAIADGKLQVVLSAFEPTPVPVSIIYANQNMLPLKTRSFIDFAASRKAFSACWSPQEVSHGSRPQFALIFATTAVLKAFKSSTPSCWLALSFVLQRRIVLILGAKIYRRCKRSADRKPDFVNVLPQGPQTGGRAS